MCIHKSLDEIPFLPLCLRTLMDNCENVWENKTKQISSVFLKFKKRLKTELEKGIEII